MSGFLCHFCNQVMSVTNDNHAQYYLYFRGILSQNPEPPKKSPIPTISEAEQENPETLSVEFYRCPNCDKFSIIVNGLGPQIKGSKWNLVPSSFAQTLPDYIPDSIRQDYTESCAIATLSPRASAVLIRRCLQGILRDFYHAKSKNLSEAIDEVSPLIDDTLREALDSIRRIGNIGAHPEYNVNSIIDIDIEDVQAMIRIIEICIHQSYIVNHDKDASYAAIKTLDERIQEKRTAYKKNSL